MEMIERIMQKRFILLEKSHLFNFVMAKALLNFHRILFSTGCKSCLSKFTKTQSSMRDIPVCPNRNPRCRRGDREKSPSFMRAKAG